MARGERQEVQDTGRKGYLEADEPWDDTGRPRIRIVEPFWDSESERLDYLFAVEETRGIAAPSVRLEAIRVNLGIPKGSEAKRMPAVRQSRRERDEELRKLREQVAREP